MLLWVWCRRSLHLRSARLTSAFACLVLLPLGLLLVRCGPGHAADDVLPDGALAADVLLDAHADLPDQGGAPDVDVRLAETAPTDLGHEAGGVDEAHGEQVSDMYDESQPPDGQPDATPTPDAGGDADAEAPPDAEPDTAPLVPCTTYPLLEADDLCGYVPYAEPPAGLYSIHGFSPMCSVMVSDFVCSSFEPACCNVSFEGANYWSICHTPYKFDVTWLLPQGQGPAPGCTKFYRTMGCGSNPFDESLGPYNVIATVEGASTSGGIVSVTIYAIDLDGDGVPDSCDPDRDGDGVPDGDDNCPTFPNPEQSTPGSNRTELCNGIDDDCDGQMDEGPFGLDWYGCNYAHGCSNWAKVACENGVPSCDYSAAPASMSGWDGDCNGIDEDCNGFADEDFCPDQCTSPVAPPGVHSDLCCHPWSEDNCLGAWNPQQEDADWDFIGDACDNCPHVQNPDFGGGQWDIDEDGLGDECDSDIDGDGEPNTTDCAPWDHQVGHDAQEICNAKDDDCDEQTDEVCIPPGQCWSESACALNSQCENAAVCPGGESCPLLPHPGQCVPSLWRSCWHSHPGTHGTCGLYLGVIFDGTACVPEHGCECPSCWADDGTCEASCLLQSQCERSDDCEPGYRCKRYCGHGFCAGICVGDIPPDGCRLDRDCAPSLSCTYSGPCQNELCFGTCQ